MSNRFFIAVCIALGCGIVIYAAGVFRAEPSLVRLDGSSAAGAGGVRTFSTDTVPSIPAVFQFTATVPSGWSAEYVPSPRALLLYDPASSGASHLEQTAVYVTVSSTGDVSVPAFFDVLSEERGFVNGHPEAMYTVRKKPSVTMPPRLPPWAGEEHSVKEITSFQSAARGIGLIYTFAKNPTLSDAVFSEILASMSFPGEQKQPLAEPVDGFAKRVTKKPFGIFVSPDNSPTPPERFTGYHTGADAEITSDEETKNIFVHAVADGAVVLVKNASGYGGLVVIRHAIAGETLYGIYGHLRLSSVLLKPTDIVKKGDVIGILGDDRSAETDGERKHLHFGLYFGQTPDIRGYVQTKDELKNWVNPLQFF